ncbi:DNA polymerase III subunit gamma and tau [Asanoa sp. WMMD1127]|uniref:DNA polymerase III subunit gamma and tau n=1 Tax=Asanoa sp. WMMD1127 TaxID=3016107 RepID=UPI0024164F86|nr:DNA polymerase III subunit gamma and tau [Asanoa sp. WMMD1127]MDG4822350.1 DNA polymerase III subunit gamma and tau [Asanoa sp. WMMD1127]
MALALYRKYRPRTFVEMVGQEHVTEPLSQALRSGRLHHAYLFSGPRGCGKTSSARILARSLNCERGPTPEPCGVCESCRSLAPDGPGSIDVIEIDAASHGGVDDARELRERAFFAPASSRFKIYVIDEAHMVSPQGFNALLKLVEEPPDYVKFIFATTEPDKVLGTIRSRTHHYPFRLYPPSVLRPYIEQLASSENVKVEPAVFPLVVRAGGGSFRDTLSVLDQLFAGAGPEGVSYARAVALLGVTDAALIDEMCDALAAGDGSAAYATIDRVAEAGHDPRRFASDLLERLRDLIVMQQVPEAAAKGLIDGPADQLERMNAQAARLGPATLSRCADIVHNGLIEMRGTTAPRLLLELIAARMLLPSADKAESGLLQRLERMERRLSIAGEQSYAEDEPEDSGPAVLAEPSTPRPAGPAPAGGGAAAARAAAAAAASRGARAERVTRVGPAAEATPADELAAPAGGAVAEVDPAEPPGAAQAGGDARRTRVVSAEPPGAAQAGGDPRRTRVVPAEDDEPVPVEADQPPRRVPPQGVMADPATPDPVIPDAGGPGALDAAAVRRVWDEIVTMVRVTNKRIAALASEATVRDIDGDTLVLTFRHQFHARTLAENAEPVSDAAYEVLGSRWQIRCELAGDERAGGGPAPARPSPAARDQGAGAPAAGGRTPTNVARDQGDSAPAAGGRTPGQDRRGGRERSSNAHGDSGASGDRSSDDDHPAGQPDHPAPGDGASTEPPRDSGMAIKAEQSAREDGGTPIGATARDGRASGDASARDRGLGSAEAVTDGRAAGGGSAPASAAGSRRDDGGRRAEPRGGSDRRDVARSAAVAAPEVEEDWPETAQPGGPAAGPADDSDWPEIAAIPASGADRAGDGDRVAFAASAVASGVAVAAPAPPISATAPDRPAPVDNRAATPTAVPTQPAPTAAPARPTPNPTPAPTSGGAAAAARAAARAAANRARAATPAAAPTATQPAADADWAGEPPFDPDYDNPGKVRFEGFDPGDEPTDEVIDEKTARQSSEQQAFALLQEALGAERIGEIDLK